MMSTLPIENSMLPPGPKLDRLPARYSRYLVNMLALMASLCSITVSATASAQEIDLGTAGQYAGFFFGNVSNLRSAGGRLAVGGNLSIGNASIGAAVPTSLTQATLVVAGNITTFSGGTIGSSTNNNYGDYVGSKAAGVAASLALHQVSFSPIDFAAESTYLNVLSQQLNAWPATGSVSQKGSTITLTGSNANVEVFDLSAAQVAGSLSLALVNVKSSATLILNVASNTQRQVPIGIATGALQNRQGQALLNLYDADVVSFSGVTVWASVLAPAACVTNSSGEIEGTIIAASWNSSMKIDNKPFVPTN